MKKRIEAPSITYKKDGKKYTLDFCRESVRFAEKNGFNIYTYKDQTLTGLSDLFYYSFRMHHKGVSRAYTDGIMFSWHGLPPSLIMRLERLFLQVLESNAIQVDGEDEKNSTVVLEMEMDEDEKSASGMAEDESKEGETS